MSKKKKQKTRLVVVVSDMHVNSTVGLIPHEIRFDDGSTRQSGTEQRWLWDQYQALLDHIKAEKRRLDARVVVVFNGDGPDRNRHSGGYDLLTFSRAEIVRFTYDTLIPLRRVADTFIVNRGTPAHEGGSGEMSELVAQRLEADKHPKRDTFSWWNVEADIGGVLFYCGHRPRSTSYYEHTRGNAARRVAHDLWDAYHRMGDRCPDVFCFSHVHHWEDGHHNREVKVVYTPPWKLCDSWGHSMGFSPKVEPVGAWLFTVKNGEYLDELWLRQPPRKKPMRL